MPRKRPKEKRRGRVTAPDGHRNLIGARIRALRLALVPKASQEDIAGRLAAQGVLLSRLVVSNIESRKRPVTDTEIVAFAKALRVTVTALFEVPFA